MVIRTGARGIGDVVGVERTMYGQRTNVVEMFQTMTDGVALYAVPIPVLRAVVARYCPNRRLTANFLRGLARLIKYKRLGALPEFNKAWRRHSRAASRTTPWSKT